MTDREENDLSTVEKEHRGGASAARPEPGSDFHRFARLVLLMRAAQRDYFRTRSGTALDQSKDLERRVDIALGWLLDRERPSSLFPGLSEPEDGDDVKPGAYGPVGFTGRKIPLRRRRQ